MTSLGAARGSGLLTRIVRGPEPPLGVGRPHPSLRCRVGLHLWAETWQAILTDQRTDGLGSHSASFGFNLDRPADYEACWRCNVMRHRIAEPAA